MAYTLKQEILSFAHAGQNGTKVQFTVTRDKSTSVLGTGTIQPKASASATPGTSVSFDIRYSSDPDDCVIQLAQGAGVTYQLASLHSTRVPAITGVNVGGTRLDVTIPSMFPGETAVFDIIVTYEPA